MSNLSYNPLKTGQDRVFVIEGMARPDHEPKYQSCMKAGAVSQSFGDVEKIECPDPDKYEGFIEVAKIQGAIERATLPLTGRYARDLESELLRIAKTRCAADIQIHMGACTDPRDFNVFQKALIAEDAILTTWNTEDLGALGSDENAKVDESTDLSIGEIYEVLPLSFAQRGDDVVTNPVVDVVICDIQSCGDCEEESDGCQKIYAVTLATGGSPGTAPDLVYSLDKGSNWAADDINSLLAAEEANALACLGIYVVVVSNDSNSLHYKAQAVIDAGTAGGWTENATGFVVTGEPNDIWSVGTYAFIVGDGGYVYGTNDPTVAVNVLDAGVATTEDLNAVHALTDEFAVAVGDNDTIIYTLNQVGWQTATATGGGSNLQCVWIKNANEWWVGDSNGQLYYTLDGGTTWTEKGIPGTLWTSINDISFSTKSVGYISAARSGTPRGYMLRTFNGGYDWVILPEDVGTLPLTDSVNAHAACQDDPNFVVGVGLADDAADGVVLVGED
jgi:photosystem II stability/assembly factor-like uncharacterized protein